MSKLALICTTFLAGTPAGLLAQVITGRMLELGADRPVPAPSETLIAESIDDLIQPGTVEGVEIYRNRTELPREFAGIGHCAAIVFWTRAGEPTRGGLLALPRRGRRAVRTAGSVRGQLTLEGLWALMAGRARREGWTGGVPPTGN